MGRLISGFFVMGLLIFFATTLPQAGTDSDDISTLGMGRAPASVPEKSDISCEKGFALRIAVNPVDAVPGSSGTGVELKVEAGGKGTVTRLPDGKPAELSARQCATWQKKHLPKFEAALAGNKDSKRANLTCINLGGVEYKAKGKVVNETVCLANAKTDKVTADFRKFFEATERLAAASQ